MTTYWVEVKEERKFSYEIEAETPKEAYAKALDRYEETGATFVEEPYDSYAYVDRMEWQDEGEDQVLYDEDMGEFAED